MIHQKHDHSPICLTVPGLGCSETASRQVESGNWSAMIVSGSIWAAGTLRCAAPG